VLQRGGKQLPLYARVKDASAPTAVVVPADASQGLQVALRPGDCAWADFLAGAPNSSSSSSSSSGDGGGNGGWGGFQPHIADAYATTNILFSSGTTVRPGVVPGLQQEVNGGAAVVLLPGDAACTACCGARACT
jgi:acetyl-CoA synthetase